LLEGYCDKVLLAAPTGRAAKRLSELTGKKATTIHRLLEVDFKTVGDEISFIHNSRNRLKCDAVIIDEMSMVDALLFENLLDALKENCRLILVGDVDQLPSVGAGNVLKGIIDSKVMPVICLKEVFRQAAQSLIVSNAHRIVKGEMPVAGAKTDDFFMIEANALGTQQLVLDLVCDRLPKSYNFSPINDIQVLCPSKIGATGTVKLNELLQERLNPKGSRPEFHWGEQSYREGDKVMQIKNNYDIQYQRDDGECGAGAFNGDIGVIESVNAKASEVKVRFDDRVYVYTTEFIRQLELAYAVTIHKSQGSEFTAVVLPVSEVPGKLCYRNLLYTGVTRAKQLLVVPGQGAVIEKMIKNDKRQLRFSCLSQFINDEN
ncbi:MAG: AAA family ATPase, partial [Oscillospiraceae bacterium]